MSNEKKLGSKGTAILAARKRIEAETTGIPEVKDWNKAIMGKFCGPDKKRVILLPNQGIASEFDQPAPEFLPVRELLEQLFAAESKDSTQRREKLWREIERRIQASLAVVIAKKTRSQKQIRTSTEQILQLLSPWASERDRAIFILYYVHGFSIGEISEIPTVNLSAKEVGNILLRLTRLVKSKKQSLAENLPNKS